MSRAIITPELADTLREIRITNGIQAKDLAAYINKSAAFISRLEHRAIQTVDTDDLSSILSFILKGSINSEEILEKIYDSLRFKFTQEEIDSFLWFTNFDTVERQIPIPESLIDSLQGIMSDNSITCEYLLTRINANEALSDEENNDETLPYNRWYYVESPNGRNRDSIKIKMSLGHLESILNKTVDIAPYYQMMAIAFYILKIKEYRETVDLSPDEYNGVLKKATDLLSRHKFYSVSEKQELVTISRAKIIQEELVSTFDINNVNYINDIITGFNMYSEYNIKLANEQLNAFAKNMHSDLGFMMKLISMDFCDLDKVSVSKKKELLDSIEILIKDYANLPESKKSIETY